MLQGIGVGKRGGGLAQLTGDSWERPAIDIRKRLFGNLDLVSQKIQQGKIKKLIVVPIGVLWYLPFEMLPTGDIGSQRLGQTVQVHYAPTPGYGLRPLQFDPTPGETMMVNGKFFAPRDTDRNATLTDDIMKATAGSVAIPPPSPDKPTAGRWLKGPAQTISVHGLIKPTMGSRPLAWSPLAYDRNAPNGNGLLSAWLRFPMVAPDNVMLPGFRSAAESPTLGNGDDIFFTLMGLHAAGVSNVMMSRWAVGGVSTSILVRESLPEVPTMGPRAAWDRAVDILKTTDLDAKEEPLLSRGDAKDATLNGEPPLFWSGYLHSGQ
ncbi:MAG: hypothetical protein AAFN70_00965 [Planctomycetota bacterium]